MQIRNTHHANLRDGAYKRRPPHQKNFDIELDKKTEGDLLYFVRQELEYYNSLINKLTPRLRAYPQDLISINDREKRVWESCAEHAVDPQKFLDYPVEQWPAHLQHLHSHLYNTDGSVKILPAQISIIGIAATPAKLHQTVRRAIANEILKYMIGQADTLLAAMKTETMKAPMQMLQTHTLDTKRHLQIPRNLVQISYDEENHASKISIPYSNRALVVPHFDLTESVFKIMLVRAPHPNSPNQHWQIDLRDGQSQYLIAMTDTPERRKK